MSTIVDASYKVESRNLGKIRSVLKEILCQSSFLLETHKIASFAVLPAGLFVERRSEALTKFFRPFTGNVKALKGNVCTILERAEVTRILKDVRGRWSSKLSSEFFLKYH